jgi:hypothetical protein
MSKPIVSAVGGAMPASGQSNHRLFLASSVQAASVFGALGVTVSASSADPEASPGEKLVTIEQAAAMEFEPWEPTPDGWRVPSNEEWMPFGVWSLPSVRIAWMMMFKTKGELETICQKLDGDAFDDILRGIGDARAAFGEFVDVLSGAEGRIMCAAASALVKGDQEGHANV